MFMVNFRKLCLIAGLTFSATHAMERVQGWCEAGNKTITVQGQLSATASPVQRSYPLCTVTVYVTGSGGTLATLYSTDAPGTPLANPFTAQASGYWAFYTVDGVYDLQFSGGGIPVPFTDGATSVIDANFDSAITGYVKRTKNAKLSEYVSIKDFGAVGDGVTDDSTALTSAMAYTSLTQCVYFPDGTYATSTTTTSTHRVCLIGNNWRLKYTGSGLIDAVFSLIFSPPGDHSSYLEGSFVQGLFADGQGHATDGIRIQGLVSGQMNYVRATNVIDAGIRCNWCQQVEFDHAQVSADYEPFTTHPARGLVVDGVSSANMFNNINIDHVTGNGIDLIYAFNSTFYGGTSEGNGGIGVSCTGDPGAGYRQCIQNSFIQFDTEANTGGDYYFGDLAYNNSIIAANSFSIPGVHFANPGGTPVFAAHGNTIVGGSIGSGSIADLNTYGNRLLNVNTIAVTGTPWTDNGRNYNDPIWNQFHSTLIEPVNNYHNTMTLKYIAQATRAVRTYTPYPGATAGLTIGDPAANFIGFDTQDGFSGSWLKYQVNGCLEFVSETAPETDAIPDGCIINHKWGFGRYNLTPVDPFHFFDAVLTTIGVQAGAGQSTAPLMKFKDFTGALMSNITYQGRWDGPLAATSYPVNGANGHALCKKAADGTFGTCSTVVAADGTCTCN